MNNEYLVKKADILYSLNKFVIFAPTNKIKIRKLCQTLHQE